MKIVILDKDTLGADIDLSPLHAVGECTEYGLTAPEQIEERVSEATVIVTNKLKLGAHNLQGAAALRLICVAATGYDNIDVAYCRSRGIALCNVPGYSTESVAQLTVAMALSLVTHLTAYREYTHSGAYTASGIANCLTPVYHELSTLTWGVVGGGGIGTRVAECAQALGCRVQMCRRKEEGAFPLCDIDTLCRTSDIISLHVPLSESTRGLINRERLAAMKRGTVLINTARGAVTDEAAVVAAVQSGQLGGLGVDVYSVEPFSEQHPFWQLRDCQNVCLTPHMAWGSVEARARCVAAMAENITRFFDGAWHNRVV